MMKFNKRLFIFFIVSVLSVYSVDSFFLQNTAKVSAATDNTIPIKISTYRNYKKAFKVLTLINKERENAGLNPVTMDKSLIKSAMTRAAESSLYWDHTRPNGSDCFSISNIVDGENIGVGASSPEYIMKSFMNSRGHKSNILDPDWISVGVGCVVVDGTYYWSQLFSSVDTKSVKRHAFKSSDTTYTINVKATKKFFKPIHKIASKTLKVGKKTRISSTWNNTYTLVNLKPGSLNYKSSNTKVCSVSKSGVVRAKKKGYAKISVWFSGSKNSCKTFTVRVK